MQHLTIQGIRIPKAENIKDVLTLIRSDFSRYGCKLSLAFLYKNYGFRYTCLYRICNYLKSGLIYHILFLLKMKLQKKYSLVIPNHTNIGYGIFFHHADGVIVNGSAIIGDNVNFHQFSTIGADEGKAAVIGNNCFIGPGVCIVENIKIGDNVVIGAGAVCVKDIPSDVTVGGVPAKIISHNNSERLIHNKYII